MTTEAPESGESALLTEIVSALQDLPLQTTFNVQGHAAEAIGVLRAGSRAGNTRIAATHSDG